MTVTARPLRVAGYLASSDATLYTAPTGTRTIVDKLTAYNGDAAPHAVTVRMVPSGGTGDATNTLAVKTLSAGESYAFPEIVGQVLEAGGKLNGFADAANAVVMRVSGREVT